MSTFNISPFHKRELLEAVATLLELDGCDIDSCLSGGDNEGLHHKVMGYTTVKLENVFEQIYGHPVRLKAVLE